MQNDTCYILALFKRDDGERLLLGSGFYEFDKGQKHFNPNTFANDIVELQGTDGQLLAGQVRRSTSQSFDGVIGDGTTTKTVVEQKRREFFLFFRKQHHYTVVYIFPDGTAIKRERGYITDAPAVQELYQVQPKWHIALAFEDVNYYSYAEDSQGNEIYSFEAELGLANIEDGGLVWDADGATSDAYVHTGKNLLLLVPQSSEGMTTTYDTGTGLVHVSGTNSSRDGKWSNISRSVDCSLPAGTYTLSVTEAQSNVDFHIRLRYQDNTTGDFSIQRNNTSKTFTTTKDAIREYIWYGDLTPTYSSVDFTVGIQLEVGNQKTAFEPYSQGLSNGGYIFAPSTGGGPIIVTVNGVDDANPVWHVYGPATNPTLTNSTTGEALTWNGTVPANQELIIDMGQQTATLEGANVFEFVSGSWVQLAPGQNRISYTAANTTRSSKVYWNEVVG